MCHIDVWVGKEKVALDVYATLVGRERSDSLVVFHVRGL